MGELNITDTELVEQGEVARASVAQITNNCGAIVDAFEGYLNDVVGLPWNDNSALYGRAHVRVGEGGEQKHYVFYLDGTYLADYESGEEVIIDLSFDQFCDRNYERGDVAVSYGSRAEMQSEQIRIMGPKDERLKQYWFLLGESLYERESSVASRFTGQK